LDFTLAPQQAEGVKTVSKWYRDAKTGLYKPDFYFGGFAGTGKTTVLPYIIDGCGLDWQSVAFLAPTGKAAKVMSKKLQAMYGTQAVVARTIHSQIYVPLRERVDALRELIHTLEERLKGINAAHVGRGMTDDDHMALAVYDQNLLETQQQLRDAQHAFDDAQRESEKSGPRFILNPDSQIKSARMIVVDEASMVGADIAEDLFSFGIPILSMGDPFQLPPVGDNPGLTVGEPDFFLTEIHRQAADNPIIRLSMDIRNGKSIREGLMGNQVRIVSRRNDKWTLNADYDAQVICGTNRKRWYLTGEIREMCGYTSTGPEEGEPLIVCKNSKKVPALVNGSFVTCIKSPGDLYDGDSSIDLTVEDENAMQYSLRVNQGTFEEHHLKQKDAATAEKYKAFDSKRRDEILDFGWVITCHKSQGSQWDNVIVHDESGTFRDDADRWLYTAVTRAAEELTVVV
jgi:exodeoxyribonuclease-5